jgi:hypothetical protein
LLVAGLSFLPVHALVLPPSACNNLYYASIDTVQVVYPGGRLNAWTNPNQRITIKDNDTYNVTMLVTVEPTSVNGSTGPGTLYLLTDFGYTSRLCYATPPQNGIDVQAGQVLNMTFTDIGQGIANTGLGVGVLASPCPCTYPSWNDTESVTFNIDWVPSIATTVTSTVTSVSTTAAPAVTQTTTATVTSTTTASVTQTVTSTSTQPSSTTTRDIHCNCYSLRSARPNNGGTELHIFLDCSARARVPFKRGCCGSSCSVGSHGLPDEA